MPGSITLTSGMRANLYTLQETSRLTKATQNRLATGKRVSSALDDPINFFTSLSHTQRAQDLLARKDEMSEAIQTVKAAAAGIEALTQVLASAQSLAKASQSAESNSSKESLAEQYQETLTQLDNIAADSGYRGINLLAGSEESLSVLFDESGDSSLTLTGVDASVAGLGLSGMSDTIVASSDETDYSISGDFSLRGDIHAFNVVLDADDQVTLRTYSHAGGTNVNGETIPAGSFDPILSIFDADGNLIEDNDDGGPNFDAQIVVDLTAGEYLVTISEYPNFFNGDAGDPISMGFASDSQPDNWDDPSTNTFYALDITNVSAVSTQWYDVDKVLDTIDQAFTRLRDYSKTLSTNLNVVTTRQEFSQHFANILNDGAAKLTNADMNEEGANMLMLRTRQQLSTTALNLASRSAQSVMRLF